MTRQERQVATLQRLMHYVQVLLRELSERSPTSHEVEYIHDAIDDGAWLLKQLGHRG